MKYVYVKTPSVEALGTVSSSLPDGLYYFLGVLVTIGWSFEDLALQEPVHRINSVRWFCPSEVRKLVPL